MEKVKDTLPLVILVGVLTWWSTIMAGPFSVPYFGVSRMLFVVVITIVYLLTLFAVILLASLTRVPQFVDGLTGQLNVRGLWACMNMEPVRHGFSFAVAVYGMTAASNLVELYRVNAKVWYDGFLWSLERPIFDFLLGSPLNIPWLWDAIYAVFWAFMMLASSLLVIHGKTRRNLDILIALVIAYFMARWIALMFPTAGPAFYRPELFNLAETQSLLWNEQLRLYMAGRIPQPGYYPGTMAMPSLHVSMAALSVWAVGREWRHSLWLSVPCLLLVWMSTVMLGWHYVVDGIGGIVVAGLACFAGSKFTCLFQFLATNPAYRLRLILGLFVVFIP